MEFYQWGLSNLNAFQRTSSVFMMVWFFKWLHGNLVGFKVRRNLSGFHGFFCGAARLFKTVQGNMRRFSTISRDFGRNSWMFMSV